ncbi:MAG: phosphoribosylanthranilate isomerase [Desulfomonilaceae bacterium]
MVRVKICGITNAEDAAFAVAKGADALGFIFAESPRKISFETAYAITRSLPPFVHKVGVFVDAEIEEVIFLRKQLELDVVQLSGAESETYVKALGPGVVKAIHVKEGCAFDPEAYCSATILLDTSANGRWGGTGQSFNWDLAIELARARPIILAGGLTPDNVGEAIRKAQPYAVDVSSGVEMRPGKKDFNKIETFIRRAKTASLRRQPARTLGGER